jgi:hypothetical protein
MADLEQATAGTKVAHIEPWGWNSVRITMQVVERATKTRLMVNGRPYNRRGRLVGADLYRGPRIEVWNEQKHPQQIAEIQAVERLQAARVALRDHNWMTVDQATADAVLALLKKEPA